MNNICENCKRITSGDCGQHMETNQQNNNECKCTLFNKDIYDTSFCELHMGDISAKQHNKSWEELRKEFEGKFDKWKIHHSSIPCIKDDYVINEIADFWLSKISQLKQEMVDELRKERLNHSESLRDGIELSIDIIKNL